MKTVFKVLLMSLFLVSCTVMYRVNDVSSKVDQANAQAATFYNQAKTNFEKVRSLQNRLVQKKVDFKKEPFKSMHIDYLKMQKVLKKISSMNVALVGRGEALKKSMAGKDKIDSKDPAYSQLREYRSYMEGASGEFNRMGGELNELGSDYSSKAHEAGIKELSAVDLRSKVDSGLSRIKKQSVEADHKIKWARTMLHRFSPEERKQKEADLDEMESILKKISLEVSTFTPLVKKFRKEVGTDEKVLVVPQMACHSILAELDRHVSDVNKLANQFNSAAQRFSAKK